MSAACRSSRRSTSARHRRRTVGRRAERIGYADGPVPGGAPSVDSFVELHIEQGPMLEDEGMQDRRGRRGPGHLWNEFTLAASVETCRHDTDGTSSRCRPWWRCASRPVSARAVRRGWGRAGRDRRPLRGHAQPGERRRPSGDDDRRPAQYRRTAARGAERGCVACRRDAAPRRLAVESETLARFEPVELRPVMVDLVEASRVRARTLDRRLPERRRPRRADAGPHVSDRR